MALDHDDQNDRPRFHQPNWAVGGDAYNVAGNVTNNYYPPATTPLSAQQQRERRAMLATVKFNWIDGLLDQSLAQALRIELGLTTQPGAVDLALPKLVQELNQPARELPAGTPISAVFGQVGGALLILGAPGAGKTTLLLELARDLLARAEADDAHPIPVVFNLSTWAANPTTLAAWLVDELSQRYDVPKKTAQQWVAADAVLPLLDGLDEVAAAQRNDCVVAINQYHNEHGFVPLAVCSRAGDYSELDYKLRLHNAVLVQPLTHEQVAAYLQRGGDQLAGLVAALHSDSALAELLDTPLLLSIAALAYAGAPATALAAATPEQQRQQLFDAYIAAMYRRRGAQPAYPAERTTRWLAWLAAQLVAHSQTVYYIERMQPDWLPTRQRRRYGLMVRILVGLLGALIIGFSSGLSGWLI